MARELREMGLVWNVWDAVLHMLCSFYDDLHNSYEHFYVFATSLLGGVLQLLTVFYAFATSMFQGVLHLLSLFYAFATKKSKEMQPLVVSAFNFLIMNLFVRTRAKLKAKLHRVLYLALDFISSKLKEIGRSTNRLLVRGWNVLLLGRNQQVIFQFGAPSVAIVPRDEEWEASRVLGGSSQAWKALVAQNNAEDDWMFQTHGIELYEYTMQVAAREEQAGK